MCMCNREMDYWITSTRVRMAVLVRQTAMVCIIQINQVNVKGEGTAIGFPLLSDHTSQEGQYLHVHFTSPDTLVPFSSRLMHIPVCIKLNKPTPQTHNSCQPGRRLRLFLEPKSLTLENTFNLFLSQLPLLLLGLLTHLQALDFSRSLACLFWRIRELAMAAAMAATAPVPLAAQARGVCSLAAGTAASMLLGPSPMLGTLPGSLVNVTHRQLGWEPRRHCRDTRTRAPG